MIGKTYTIEELKEKDLIIFESIMGSHAYGTALPTSDTDIRGVFMQPLEDILKYGYEEQVSDETNDTTYYELRRFVQLLMGNNPNIVELVFAPDDCVLKETEEWKMLKVHAKEFLTKRCRWTFAGYAIEQISKSRGYNKKMNWEEDRMVRKTVLDFCYVLQGNDSVPFQYWIDQINANQGVNKSYKNFSLAKINHAHDVYAMFEHGNVGIVSDPDKANDVQLTSIPKDVMLTAYLTFNKDAYSIHCKEYKEYQTWMKERNPERIKMNKAHGKNYDSKNMMHTYRLLNVALEIAKTHNINVRRSDEEINTLMKIRRGEYEYDDLLNEAEAMIKSLEDVYAESTLPKDVDVEFAYSILLDIREHKYFSHEF